jgi:hypothetical protein
MLGIRDVSAAGAAVTSSEEHINMGSESMIDPGLEA